MTCAFNRGGRAAFAGVVQQCSLIQLNHTIVHSRDKEEAARFLVEILGVAEPAPYGPFLVVQVGEVSLDFADESGAVTPQHYAFLVGEAECDAIFGRIRDRGLDYWADPFQAV